MIRGVISFSLSPHLHSKGDFTALAPPASGTVIGILDAVLLILYHKNLELEMANLKKILFFFVLFSTILILPVSAADSITVAAKSALLIDVNSGNVLMEQNADEKRYPASLTKIMTALVVSERCSLTDSVTVHPDTFSDLIPDGSSVSLREGEVMTVEHLLYCMLLASGNDAANALAIHTAGSLETFYDLMNRKAADLGCTNTHFANAHGLQNPDHYTTARDLYRITRAFIQNSTLLRISNTVSYVIPATNKSSPRILSSTNYLINGNSTIRYLYTLARGIKTGTTSAAGHCLISSAEKNGLYLVSIVLGADKDADTGNIMSFVETKRMLEWAFNNFTYHALINAATPIVEVPVSMGQDADSVTAVTQTGVTCLMYKDFDPAGVVVTPWLYENALVAPIVKGQVLGEADIAYEGVSYGRVKLVALTGVERSNFDYNINRLSILIRKPVFIFSATGIVVLVATYFVLSHVFRRKKRLREIQKWTRRY